jgi:hypothetical protein
MKAVCPMAMFRREKSVSTPEGAAAFKRDVGAEIEIEVTDATILEFQIAIAHQTGTQTTESLEFRCNGTRVDAQEIIGDHDTRIHRFKPRSALSRRRMRPPCSAEPSRRLSANWTCPPI